MSDDKKDLGIVIGQLEYLTNEVHDMRRDISALAKSHAFFKGKVIGASIIAAFIISAAMELMRL